MAESRFCPACGTPREPDGKFCASCGRPFEEEKRKKRGAATRAKDALEKADSAADVAGTAKDATDLASAAKDAAGDGSDTAPAEAQAQMGAEPPAPAPPPQAPAAAGRGARFGRIKGAWVIGSGIVGVAATVVSLLVFLPSDEASAGEVFLEPAGSVGSNPFTPSVGLGTPDVGLAATPPASGAPGGVRSHPGNTPGLYGGTQDDASCDIGQLERFLVRNPEKARAWVGALNGDPGLRWSGGSRVGVDQIGAYLAELTPLVLRADTRVTNHGFSGGVAFPLQSVLQAGTSVLVDAYGIPRARCACGNPLIPPHAVADPTYTGSPWPGFGPATVVVIVPPPTIIVIFVVVDTITGDPFGRPPGTSGTEDGPAPTDTPTPGPTLSVPPDVELGEGDVQVTLLWSGGSDLDLHVVDPEGSEIYYGAPTSTSGGQLDHDDTAGCGGTGTHVENVYWSAGAAPVGEYRAFVVNYSPCAAETFELRITVAGEVVHSSSGTVPGESSAQSTPVTFSR
ncbi:MAG TPA: DUF6777 domain-containing protein [Actinomycetota bacterium]